MIKELVKMAGFVFLIVIIATVVAVAAMCIVPTLQYLLG